MVGISYTDLLDMDIRMFNCFISGYIDRREIYMNDIKTVGHLVAGKIAAAVWGDKSFKRPIDDIKLHDDNNTAESRNLKVFKTLRAKGLI